MSEKTGIGIDGTDNVEGYEQNGHGMHRHQTISTAKLAITLLIVSLASMFAAVAFLWVFRLRDRLNFVFKSPDILWLSTFLILASSVTFVLAVRAIRRDDQKGLRRNMYLTAILGGLFVVSQLVAWGQLINAGVYAQNNPFSGLFYVMTGVHAFHVLIGLVWLGFIISLMNRSAFTSKKHLAISLSASYWHLMDAVWIVFFILLVFF
jgi:cytochrome c oxidase subunit 3